MITNKNTNIIKTIGRSFKEFLPVYDDFWLILAFLHIISRTLTRIKDRQKLYTAKLIRKTRSTKMSNN